MAPKSKVPVTTRLSPELKQRIKELAEERGMVLERLISDLLVAGMDSVAPTSKPKQRG